METISILTQCLALTRTATIADDKIRKALTASIVALVRIVLHMDSSLLSEVERVTLSTTTTFVRPDKCGLLSLSDVLTTILDAQEADDDADVVPIPTVDDPTLAIRDVLAS
jgi:hypothetical protein